MNRIYLYLIIVILGLALFFTCGDRELNCNGNTTKIDTVITTKSDTIWAKDTVFSFKYKTVVKPVNVYLNPQKDTIRVYHDTLSDSNVDIMVKDTVRGSLLGQNVTYKLKVPLKIIDSIFVNITKTEIPKRKPKLLVGIGTSEGIQNLNISPLVGFQASNGRIALYEYNTWSKSHNIKLIVPLSFPKKESK